MTRKCSKCGGDADRPNQRYCRACHNGYMKKWRPAYAEMTETEKKKQCCRALSRHAQANGKLTPGPCFICGTTENIEKHHPDYSKPLEVIWLCRKHHRFVHNK